MAFKTVEEGEVSEDMTTGKREEKKYFQPDHPYLRKLKDGNNQFEVKNFFIS